MYSKFIKHFALFCFAFISITSYSFAATLTCDNCSDCNAVIAGSASKDIIQLTNDILINGTCIDIAKSNTIFDCQDNTINGNGTGFGITIGWNKENISVSNCNLNNFSRTIQIGDCMNVSISYVNINNSVDYAILAWSYGNYDIHHNNIHNTQGTGLLLNIDSILNKVYNNNFINNVVALSIVDSNNSIYNNVITNNANSGIIIAQGKYNIISNNIIQYNNIGVNLRYNGTDNNTFIGNNIQYNTQNIYFDFWLDYPKNNTFIGNNLGNSSLINTDTGTWVGFESNNFTGNFYSDYIGPGPLCFVDGSACDNTASLFNTITISKHLFFPFGNLLVSIIIIIGGIFFI